MVGPISNSKSVLAKTARLSVGTTGFELRPCETKRELAVFSFFEVFFCVLHIHKREKTQLWQWGNESNSRLNSVRKINGGGGWQKDRQYSCKRCAPIVVETKNASLQLNIGIEIFPPKSAAMLLTYQCDALLFVFVGRF